MKTLNVGINMDQGADFNLTIGIRGVSGPIDLTGYSFLGDMRLTTDPKGAIAGGARATGSITFTANPVVNDTITINGVVITFVSTTPIGNQVLIGTTVLNTACALLQFLKLSANVNLTIATYCLAWPGSVSIPVINITYDTVGIAGNAYTLVVSSAGITVSGATLIGGINPAQFSFIILDQAANKGQVQMSLAEDIVSTIGTSISNDLQTKRLRTPYVFDVKMQDTLGSVTRILQGLIYVSPQATQEVFP